MTHLTKRIATLAAAAALTLSSAAPVSALAAQAQPYGTWVASGSRWWYRNLDGSYPADAWLHSGGCWFYFDASGWMATGWRQIGGTWYYFDGSGAMATGWRILDGTWYYLDGSGAMAKGWRQYRGLWFYFDPSGAMAQGEWRDDYYLAGSGAMAQSTWTPDGYYVGPTGAWDRSAVRPNREPSYYIIHEHARRTVWMERAMELNGGRVGKDVTYVLTPRNGWDYDGSTGSYYNASTGIRYWYDSAGNWCTNKPEGGDLYANTDMYRVY